MKRRTPPASPPEPFHRPFASLKVRLRPPPEEPVAPRGPPLAPKVPRRAVIRLERKGRGGKEVTLVEQLGLEADQMAKWLGELKRSLGCGGTVEESALLFQGDQRERLASALRARGVERISVG